MSTILQNIPSFVFTKKVAELCREIDTLLKSTENFGDRAIITRLRKVSRVNSIRSTLAIEGSGLSWEQVRDTIEGKNVEGPFDEIVEAKNAAKAYGMIEKVDVYSEECFLKVEEVLMWALTEKPGYRDVKVRIADSERTYYVPPDPELVEGYIGELFGWMERSGYPLYLTAAVAHYYIESIHPFPDGNGRMGRYWHNAVLLRHSRAFRMVSVENAIKTRQTEYYEVLERCQKADDCTEFLEFMLEITAHQLTELQKLQDPYIDGILRCMGTGPMTSGEIMRKLRLKDRGNFQKMYLKPAMEAGFVEMTDPEHPHSPQQRYVKLVR